MTVTMETSVVHKVVGREKIRVKAGSFDTLRIESDTTLQMSFAGPGAEKLKGHMPGGPHVSHSSVWVAEGVGLIKSKHGEEPSAITTELESYSIP